MVHTRAIWTRDHPIRSLMFITDQPLEKFVFTPVDEFDVHPLGISPRRAVTGRWSIV